MLRIKELQQRQVTTSRLKQFYRSSGMQYCGIKEHIEKMTTKHTILQDPRLKTVENNKSPFNNQFAKFTFFELWKWCMTSDLISVFIFHLFSWFTRFHFTHCYWRLAILSDIFEKKSIYGQTITKSTFKSLWKLNCKKCNLKLNRDKS